MSDVINMQEKRSQEIENQVDIVHAMLVLFAKMGTSKENIRVKLRELKFVEEVINLAFKREEESSEQEMESSVLYGERYDSLLNWYYPVKTPSQDSRWGRLVLKLKGKGWPEENIKSLNDQSDMVVSSLASPNSDKPEVVKGLVLGYVQSGKTANFSAVIAKATDEGYRLVIVLSGRHNGLRSQTERRLQSELVDGNSESTFTLTNRDPNGDFNGSELHPNSLFNTKDKFTLLVMKKNSSPLEKFYTWIEGADPIFLKKCPVLIVDDEADEASVNNSIDPRKPTSINKIIRKIMDFLGARTVCSYVGYTATPFANILINADDTSDLFPRDFMIALSAPSSYTGTERLFGRASVDLDGGKEGLELIRTIEIGDAITEDDQETKQLPKSMRKAVLLFLLAAGERIKRKHLEKHITMLIHTSHLKLQHATICGIVDRLKKEIDILIGKKDEPLITELKDLWETDIVKTANDCFEKVVLGSFEQALEGLVHFLPRLEIIKENSDSITDDRLNFENGPVWAIIVGGNTLSRGLTIEGLTTTYFHRTTDGYDTLLQMGRWFGYRDDFLDLIRIYVTKDMKSNFYHLATVEHELREDIARMQINGERPIDIAIKIRDHDRLKITNKVVLKQNAQISSKTYSGSKIQATHLFLDNKEFADNNLKCVQTLLAAAEKKDLRQRVGFTSYRDCILYKDLESSLILDFLNNYTFSERDLKFNYSLLKGYISNLNSKNEMNKWSVAVISNLNTNDDSLLSLGVADIVVTPVARTCSRSISAEEDIDGVIVRTITAPKDEVIDLADISSPEIQAILEGNGPKITDVKIRSLRPANRPLLLIYPIDTQAKKESKRIQSRGAFKPIEAPFKHLFGISIVFPTTKQEAFDSTYIYNGTLRLNR